MRFYLSLYLLVAGFYLLTASGRIGLSDSVAMFRVSQSLIDEHSISSDPCEPDEYNRPTGAACGCVPGNGGRHYAAYGLVPSFLVVPAILVARFISHTIHVNPLVTSKTGVSLFSVLVAPLVCVVLANWIMKLGYSRSTAIAGACILAFASPFWDNAVMGFLSEPYFTLALVTAACILSSPRRRFACALAGLAFGVACATRMNGAILFPAFILFMVFHNRILHLSNRYLLSDVLQFSASFSACALFIALTNYARFGSPFKTGYHLVFPSISKLLSTPLFQGLSGVLFSGEVGLLIFAPWILIAVICFPRFARAHLPESVLCAASVSIYVMFFAKYTAWHGGSVAGPRLLIPVLPMFVILITPIIQDLCQSRDFKQRSLASLGSLLLVFVVAAFIVQLFGTTFPVERYYALTEFYKSRPAKPWWYGSIPLASIDFLSKASLPTGQLLHSIELDPRTADQEGALALSGADSASTEDYFLSRFPNPVNKMSPNLIWVKFGTMGLPALAGPAYFVIALAIGIFGAAGVMRTSP
jgi:hypothetical protein